MNLYIRYFDKEILVYSVEEALDFLRSIPEVDITPSMEKDIREFASNDMFSRRDIRFVRAYIL